VAVYEVVCAQHRDQMVWHESMLGKHMRRARFRLAVALDDDDRIVAFSWGYTGYRGSGGPTGCRGPRSRRGRSLVGGHFEVVEIAVPDQGERQVIVKRLHDRLLRGLAEAACADLRRRRTTCWCATCWSAAAGTPSAR